MTAYCPTIGSYWGSKLREGVGVSNEAIIVSQKAEEWLKDYLEPRLLQIVPDIRYAVRESHSTAVPVEQGTFEAAVTFASLLPRSVPIPEVSADPDGEIAFDWIGPSQRIFSVSVNKAGRLAYAGWFGEDKSVHGTESLNTEFPQEVIRALIRATK
jgi:hypothetical protein